MTQADGSLKPDFERLVEMDFECLLGAHGEPLMGGVRAALEATIARVLPERP
jgi:hypothetical protein